MFRVFIDRETNEYCLKYIDGTKSGGIYRYSDFREFAADLKRRMEHETTVSEVHANAIKDRRKSAT